MWHLKAYPSSGATHVVEDWLSLHRAEAKLKARFMIRMMHLRQQPPSGWPRQHFHLLRDAHGVGAVTMEYKNVQHRPLGFFGPGSMAFTFLYFATERGDAYQPVGCIAEAVRRMRIVIADPTVAKPWRF